MQLSWIKCQGDVWCKLDSVNLGHPHFSNMDGVYIIWHGGTNAATVYVGQGNIRDRLNFHRTNQEVQAYSSLGLFATWAMVPVAQRNGVEVYLARRLQPLVGEAHPDVGPIEVNVPW